MTHNLNTEIDIPGCILMAGYFLCSVSLDNLFESREGFSSPLDGGQTLVSFWFGGVNRGVTDPTKTSILPLITSVVSEAAVQNLKLCLKLHKINCRNTCRFRSTFMKHEEESGSAWVFGLDIDGKILNDVNNTVICGYILTTWLLTGH